MLLAESGLLRSQVLLWNIVPWFLAGTKPSAPAIRAGAEHLERLLPLLTNLKVVVLMGSRAQSGWKWVRSETQGRFRVLSTYHPGGQSLNPQPERRAHILHTFQAALRIAEAAE
jgi:uracil-DNA glycosylase